jgi:hypothetical protein
MICIVSSGGIIIATTRTRRKFFFLIPLPTAMLTFDEWITLHPSGSVQEYQNYDEQMKCDRKTEMFREISSRESELVHQRERTGVGHFHVQEHGNVRNNYNDHHRQAVEGAQSMVRTEGRYHSHLPSP